MEKWNDFLDGIASRGGAILCLFVLFVISGLLVFHILHHSDSDQVTTVILSAFSSLLGALLTVLTTQAKVPNGNGTTETTTEVHTIAGNTGKPL